jgi:hypothetical protein
MAKWREMDENAQMDEHGAECIGIMQVVALVCSGTNDRPAQNQSLSLRFVLSEEKPL